MKMLTWIILILLLMTPRANAYWEEVTVEKDGSITIIGHYSNELEVERARLLGVLAQKRNQLAALVDQRERKERWLIEGRYAHEVKLKEIEEETSANFLEAVRLEASMNRNSQGEYIYVNNSR